MRRRVTPGVGPTLVFTGLAIIAVSLLQAAGAHPARGDSRPALQRTLPFVRPASLARGRSGAVHMMTALPDSTVDVPLEVLGSPAGLSYYWQELGGEGVDSLAPRPLSPPLRAPARAGFYRLAIVGHGERRFVDSLLLGVMIPAGEKRGPSLNGYRMGFYRGERRGSLDNAPAGYLEVGPEVASLPVSAHLTIADFLTRDTQTSWPRYVAMDTRLLDKLELVFEKLLAMSDGRLSRVDVDVHSGFRTPFYNSRVSRSAEDSRHQYGDAVDLAVDANGDGRVSASDVFLVARAVHAVEEEHPELAGGLGLYTRGSTYAHIDARGRSARWRG